jgi:two-component system, cell cycle sensor histidine kinase and response regulator CckA
MIFFASLLHRIFLPKPFLYPDADKDDLNYWRERIVLAVLAAGGGLSVVALAPAVYLALTRGLWLLLVVDFSAFLITVTLLVSHRFGLRTRAMVVLLVTFTVGVAIIVQVGFLSAGTAWLFCFSVLAGILLGLRGALAATLLNAVAIVLLAWLAYPKHPLERAFLMSFSRSITAGVNFIFLNGVAAISVAALVNGLLALNRKTAAATAALNEEKAALLKARESLKEEIAVRKNSEKALQRSERQYRLLAENIKDVIWTMDLNFRFTYVSSVVKAMQGWTPEEMLELRLENIMAASSLEMVLEVFNRKYALGQQTGAYNLSATVELELFRKDGSMLWTEVTASFILDEAGLPVGILGVTRDISERRKAQEEKEKLLENLNQSRKMEAIGRLAGGVAHDLNNVLSGIVSYPDLLLLDLPEDSPNRGPLETIRESGQKAAAIVQDLLTLARRGVAVAEVLNLNDLIRKYLTSPEFKRLESFHPLVDLDLRLDSALENIKGSPIHLSKTIMNLVSNAAEAMPDGGKIELVTCNRSLTGPVQGYAEVRQGDYVVVRISDSGIGISTEDIHRIFEPFYTKKKMGRSGTGLGMTIVWGTVEDHQGYIDVQSTPGKGTTVTLYLPATHQEQTSEGLPKTASQYQGHGETVLVVDDVREQREIATRILEQLGYAVSSVASGEEAVEFIRKGKIDLVILDMIMEPGIDGLETYRRILQFNPRQRSIITSGFSETDRVKGMQQLGAGTYLRKPYTVEGLGMAVKSELESSS